MGTTLFASLLSLFLPQMLGMGKGVTIEMMDATMKATKEKQTQANGISP